jgi:hypothetical protein
MHVLQRLAIAGNSGQDQQGCKTEPKHFLTHKTNPPSPGNMLFVLQASFSFQRKKRRVAFGRRLKSLLLQ